MIPLRHPASPHGQEFNAQVDPAGFDQARHGPWDKVGVISDRHRL